jgi:hypothetical protein
MQQCINILLFHVYMKPNMFHVFFSASSSAEIYTGSLWFFIGCFFCVCIEESFILYPALFLIFMFYVFFVLCR